MVIRSDRRALSQIAATTALLSLVLNLALPLLDVSSVAGAALETDHDHSCFVASHDHSICNQFENKRLSTDDTRPTLLPPRIAAYATPEPPRQRVIVALETPSDPRAPPLI